MRNRLILVTKDKALVDVFQKSCERRRARADVAATPREAFAKWQDENCPLAGVVGDMAMMDQNEKVEILQAHCQPGSPPLILLDLPGIPDPRNPTEFVTRMRWPLAAQFLEQLKELSKVPMVFLADPTLFVTGMLQARLASIGISTIPIESHMAIVSMLQGTGGKALANAAVVQFRGDIFDASPIEQKVREQIPNVRFFLISAASASHNVERALKRIRPAFIPRDMSEHAVDILLKKQVQDPMGLGRVILVDNFKPALIQQTADLMKEGYEVAACMKAEEAIEFARTDSYHIAVVGAALAYAEHTGVELAQKLRELDPDLRIILMVDQYPIQTALKGVTQVVEVGLDDCLLKPVEPSRLRFSISRALERRRLLLENKRLLSELTSANEELEQLSGFQQKFFATVAHDVKNPLTAIRGYAEMLSWKVKDETQLKCVTHIQSSTRTLEGLISDLVDFAAIENGKLRINPEEIDLGDVVREVESRVKVAADKRKITVHLDCPTPLPKIQGDPLRLGQVVQNLSTNAIQYTPEGGNVYIKVRVRGNIITVSVRDTGIGISKEDLPRIFQRFFQTEKAQKMRRAGFGLGLKIAQEIVKAHGGGLGVDSEEGQGSVFYFTVPVQPGTQAPLEEAQPDAVPAGPPKPAPTSPAPGYPSMTSPNTPTPGKTQPMASPPTAPPRPIDPGKTQPMGAPPTAPGRPLDPRKTQPMAPLPTSPMTAPRTPIADPGKTQPMAPLGAPPTTPGRPLDPRKTQPMAPLPNGAPTAPPRPASRPTPPPGSPPPPPGID